MARRTFLTQLAALPFLAFSPKIQEAKKPLHIMMKGAWGSDDPTRAAFPSPTASFSPKPATKFKCFSLPTQPR
jgi:hypothetical protein